MKKSTLIAITTAAIVGGLGLSSIDPAFAYGDKKGPRGFGPHITFAELDANGDGQVTAEELAALRSNRFDAQDTNGDGLLSVDEMTAAAVKRASERAAKHIERMMKKRDANGDGQISLAELPGQGRSEKMLKHMDENGDGTLSADEFAAAQAKFAEHWKHRADQ